MKILALETTGKYGSAAVIDDGRVYCAESSGEMNHLKEIIKITGEALEAAGITKKELTHIAASVGPGSFTGIRIGVTVARTMAQMLDLPCVAVSSLESMAENVKTAAMESGCETVAAVINARRHQTYAGAWSIKDGKLIKLLDDRQYMIEEFLEQLAGNRVYFVGDGIDAYEEIIQAETGLEAYVMAEGKLRYQTAEAVAKLAAEAASEGNVVGYEELMPDYMRLSEAEQRLKEGTLSDKIKKLNRRG